MTNNNQCEFTFSRHDDIGAAAAEDDSNFLVDCFVDNGDLDIIVDCNNPKSLLVGRTGAGKSALINALEYKCHNVIQLSPHSLSLNYIANNNVISFFEASGVNLSVFYGLLWKHIFVVELLKEKFDIRNEDSQRNYARHIKNILYKKDAIKEQAVDYLENWGNKFWLTTEERMHELTDKVEYALKSGIESKIPGVKVSASGAASLSTEQKRQVVELGKKAVSEVQVRELENIISILSEDIFTDSQQFYYITIDMLDEDWVDDRIKFKLIKSLIDTIRRFRKVDNVKVIAALREDLLYKVIHSTREPGFQEEKYTSLYLHLHWTKPKLKELIEKRINYLIKRKYTKGSVSFNDIFPVNVNQTPAIDYILDRTYLRPRDVILYLNECIRLADNEPKITSTIIKTAEEYYSNGRLQSLATEWLNIHPNLYCVTKMFFGMRASFRVSDITKEFIEEKYTEVIDHIDDSTTDPITAQIEKLYSDEGNFNSIRNNVIRYLYTVGLIGIKKSGSATTNWSYLTNTFISSGDIKPNSLISIHPMFYRALDVHHK